MGASSSLGGGFVAALRFRLLMVTVVGCGRLGSSPPSSALTVALLLRFAGPFFSDMDRLSGLEDSGLLLESWS